MSKLLNGIGFASIIVSFLAGITQGIYGSGWLAALLQIIGGIVAAIIFFALALILDRLDENREYLEILLDRTEKPVSTTSPYPANARPKAKSKSALESLKDFKLNAKD